MRFRHDLRAGVCKTRFGVAGFVSMGGDVFPAAVLGLQAVGAADPPTVEVSRYEQDSTRRAVRRA